LRDKLRHQQETFADDKRQLVSGNIILCHLFFVSYDYHLKIEYGFRRPGGSCT
jgi:hypothetical protein